MICKTDECTYISSVEFKPVFSRDIHTLSLHMYKRARVYNTHTGHTRIFSNSILGKRPCILCFYNKLFTNNKTSTRSIVIFQCMYGASCTVFYYPDQTMQIYIYICVY
jgi:hypothetical protein